MDIWKGILMESSTSRMERKLSPPMSSEDEEKWIEIKDLFDSPDLINVFNRALMPPILKYIAKKGWQAPTSNAVGKYVLSCLPIGLVGKVYEPALKLSTNQDNIKKAFDITKSANELCGTKLRQRDQIALIIIIALEKLFELRALCPSSSLGKPEVVEIIDNVFAIMLGINAVAMPISQKEFMQRKIFLLMDYGISKAAEKALSGAFNKLIEKYSKLAPDGRAIETPSMSSPEVHPREQSTFEIIAGEFDQPLQSLSEHEPDSEQKSTPR